MNPKNEEAKMHSRNYRITTESYLFPYDGLLIFYAPLKGVVARINPSAATLLRRIIDEKSENLNVEEIEFLRQLEHSFH